MFDTFFSQIKVRSRMESGPIGAHLSEIAAVLHRDGYSRGTILPVVVNRSPQSDLYCAF
jgi:hypothetical protein